MPRTATYSYCPVPPAAHEEEEPASVRRRTSSSMSREHGTGIGTDNDTFGLAEAHWEVEEVGGECMWEGGNVEAVVSCLAMGWSSAGQGSRSIKMSPCK